MARRLLYKNPKSLKKSIDAYFADCDDKKKPYTVTGLTMALGMSSRRILLDYQTRGDFGIIVTNAKLRIENYLEQKLLTEKHVIGHLFNLKNNFGWKDSQELQHGGQVGLTVKIVKFSDGNKNPK